METPVQSYSSGMQVRLGFAVAAQMEPDVLILDEVLAVGDMSFQARCFNAIYRLTQKSAVIFVSHSMPAISRICSHVSVLEKGRQYFLGSEVATGIEQYNTLCAQDQTREVSGSKRAVVHSVEFESGGRRGVNTVNYGESLTIHAETTIDPTVHHPGIAFAFMTPDMRLVAQCASHFNQFRFENKGERITLQVDLGRCCLDPGIYWLMVAVQSEKYGEILVRYMNYMKIQVTGWFTSGTPVLLLGSWKAEI